MKVGTIVEIIKSAPTELQTEIDLNQYIGTQCTVLEHWKQAGTELEEGEVFVELPHEGLVILNPTEYKEVCELAQS